MMFLTHKTSLEKIIRTEILKVSFKGFQIMTLLFNNSNNSSLFLIQNLK